jgi:isoleucyl-tRNA synthetase
VVELSAFYFDVLKDRLYTYAPRSQARRAAQTTIWRISEALVRLLAPIMSFTSEEVWQYLPPMADRPQSVQLSLLPSTEDILGAKVSVDDRAQSEDWTSLRQVREEVLKKLEEARATKMIGGGLEAQIILKTADPLFTVLSRYQEQLRYLFIVSAVTLEKASAGNGTGTLTVEVKKADGQKCERCWNYSVRVGEDPEYPTVCERCSAVLREIAGKN